MYPQFCGFSPTYVAISATVSLISFCENGVSASFGMSSHMIKTHAQICQLDRADRDGHSQRERAGPFSKMAVHALRRRQCLGDPLLTLLFPRIGIWEGHAASPLADRIKSKQRQNPAGVVTELYAIFHENMLTKH